MWGNWKDTSSFGGPSHLRGPHQSICGQEVADAAQGSVFTGPALFTEQGRMGGGLWAVPAGDLHTKVTGPWGLPPPRVHPPLWDVPLHPLQHRLWSGLLGPCLSPGHPVSPPLGSDILPLCPQDCPTALVRVKICLAAFNTCLVLGFLHIHSALAALHTISLQSPSSLTLSLSWHFGEPRVSRSSQTPSIPVQCRVV